MSAVSVAWLVIAPCLWRVIAVLLVTLLVGLGIARAGTALDR